MLYRDWIIGLPVSGILLFSSFPLIDNSYHFLSTIYSYQICNQSFGIATSMLLPFFQLTIGLALLTDERLRRPAFVFSAFLFFSFATLQIITLARGLNISCGSFGGSASNPIGIKSISISAIGFLLSCVGFCTKSSAESREQTRSPGSARENLT
ncbi:MauE/DoxX family redox-associated membrane protein [Telmatocola sphagniphila]|uniref:MauE/DoxX family redox-associated membrane protein n=1 Tax=Telmatocola sphagniphila TaxID=1123043 RepID=UPI0036F2E8FC